MSETLDTAPPGDQRASLRAELGSLTTEEINPHHARLDTYSTAELVEALNAEDASVPAAVALASDEIAAAVDAIVERMQRGGRLIYCGAGTAGRIGVLDASECPPTFGTDPALVVGVIAGGPGAIQQSIEDAEDDTGSGRADLDALGIGAVDTIVGMSASGRTPYVVAALEYAKERGALTVSIACNGDSDIAAVAEHSIDVVVGPELLSGSTRLKAGTAQKLVCNALSTLSMIRLGKTYGNLMVDLRATNEKLRARAERTIMLAAGVEAGTAATALTAAGGSVKEAILALKTGLGAEDSQRLLLAHDGFLREAIEAAQGAPVQE